MAFKSALLAASLLSSLAVAQQIGTAVPEVHPRLMTARCTLANGCRPARNSIVVDAFSRSLHKVGDVNTSCTIGDALCKDAASCGKNCALEGMDYANKGVVTQGGSLTLNQWLLGTDGKYKTVTPRTYLLDESGKNYESLQLLNAELTFDVDVSTMVCGMNGALYFSEMEMDGGRNSSLNPAGAEYGTGYCDAQCPTLDFINGQANIGNKYGACCNEMDIFEANALAQSLTPHPCNATRVYKCSGADECGQPTGVCDKWGCSYNPYQHGATEYYGRNLTVDTNRKFTVVTQFLTDTGTAAGSLNEIRRLYIQDGKLIKNVAITPAAGLTVDSITNGYCQATASFSEQRGGLKRMGEAIGRGMVLIFSIWADDGGFMNWLDSGNSGPCNATEGDPALIVKEHPEAAVTFSNIRWGEIGSTYHTAVKCKKSLRAIR
ncbi:glycoside hydrolase family 7 protein [Podospora appendiculata]|uniref:Glucanase n=1 Tax=Podospora appendiculata TaxID=314037 RepID=A0AAE1CDN9_9PEZI|nr:glycoside hydrolase family 7 protein [Podospora appendiculata]